MVAALLCRAVEQRRGEEVEKGERPVGERKEVGWWAGGMGLLGRGEKKRGEGEMWAGLGREKKEVFFFLTQTHLNKFI